MKPYAAMFGGASVPLGPPVVAFYTGAEIWDTNATSRNATFLPDVGDLVVCIVGLSGAATAGSVTDSQGGTYTLAVSQTRSGGADTVGIFVRNSLITSAVSTTVTTSGQSHTGGGIAAFKVTNMGANVGSSAIRLTGVSSNAVASGTALSISMGGTMLTKNPVFTADACQSASNSQVGPSGGWDGVCGGNFSTPVFGIKGYGYQDGFSGTTVTWQSGTSSGVHWGVAVELNAP